MAGEHSPGWQVAVAESHSSEQHAPARSQGWPSEAQPAGFLQTRAPLAFSPQRNEQQSSGALQVSPSRPQTVLSMQTAPTQRPEQHASELSQLAPFGWHSTGLADRIGGVRRQIGRDDHLEIPSTGGGEKQRQEQRQALHGTLPLSLPRTRRACVAPIPLGNASR